MKPFFVVCFVLECTSFVSCLAVITYLLRYSGWRSSHASCFAHLLLYLNLSLITEQILTFPFVYKGNVKLCTVVQSLYYYFGLMNCLTVAIIIQAHRSTLLGDCMRYTDKLLRYYHYILTLFPLIVFIPLFTHDYEDTDYPWCVQPYHAHQRASFAVFYAWVYLLMAYSSVNILTIAYRLIAQRDEILRKRFFSTVGFFIIVSVVFWLVRVTQHALYTFDHHNASDRHFFWSFLPTYVSGTIYAGIFFIDKRTLSRFDHNRLSTTSSTVEYEDHKLLKEWLETTSFPDDDEPRISLLSEDSREEARL